MTRSEAIRRRIRTYVQAAVAVVTVLGVVVPIVLEAIEPALPPSVYAVIAGGGAAVVAVSGALARVMAHPAVATLIDRYAPWLSAYAPEDRAELTE